MPFLSDRWSDTDLTKLFDSVSKDLIQNAKRLGKLLRKLI